MVEVLVEPILFSVPSKMPGRMHYSIIIIIIIIRMNYSIHAIWQLVTSILSTQPNIEVESKNGFLVPLLYIYLFATFCFDVPNLGFTRISIVLYNRISERMLTIFVSKNCEC